MKDFLYLCVEFCQHVGITLHILRILQTKRVSPTAQSNFLNMFTGYNWEHPTCLFPLKLEVDLEEEKKIIPQVV